MILGSFEKRQKQTVSTMFCLMIFSARDLFSVEVKLQTAQIASFLIFIYICNYFYFIVSYYFS
jgi:hypothetical protein